jgi:amino acid adenylation domain-containing protein
MLTDAQREALVLRLRQGRRDAQGGRGDAAGRISRRDARSGEPPQSYGQEQLWFIDRWAPGLPTYNIPLALRLSGPLEAAALARALDALVARHEALRTRLVTGASGLPAQVIDPPGPRPLELTDLTGFEPGKRETRLREILGAESMRPFDLAAGPLLRTSLVRMTPAEHVLVVVVHHAVFDGWSVNVLVRDLAAQYAAEVTGEPPGLAELPVQFADYAVWERARLHGPVLDALESYWRVRLAGAETVQFPTDRPRPVIDSFDGGLAVRTTDRALLTDLREVSRREGVTLFMTLMAALLAVLHRYTGQDDLVVGTVSANRGRPELTPLIGFLVNTLPIRCDLSGDPEFTALLGRVKEATVGAFAHQNLPFGKLVETIGAERDASRAPVFQIALTYAEPDDAAVPAAGVDFARTDLVRGIEAAKFDLTFAVEARREGLWIECSYKTALFDPPTIDRLLGHLEMLLTGVAANPSARLSQLPLLTEPELRAELADWNDTAAPLPPGRVHEGFEAQAAATPDAIAASCEDQRISYAELDRWADQIAARLRTLGVGPESLVGVRMRTSLARLATLLGVWKAGGGYVPLDPAAPAERLSFMIADTAMTVLVTDTGTEIVGQKPRPSMDCDPRSPANVAYVIYTSGSTGQPKGVVIEHRNAVNFLRAMIERWRIGPGSAVLQFASYTFDVSVMDMFMPLLAGGRVVLASPETLHSPPRLAALIRDRGVTFACLPPAVLGLLPREDYPSLDVLMAAGEELPTEVARAWIRPGLRLVNGYGPTEATVIATHAELTPATPMPPPIGLPVRPNYQAYVLDPHLNPVPVGVTGELHLGGASVARGYLNRPALTKERFIPDPFRPGQRLYKTGDLARRRPDGTIVFIGRVDNQVKLRGLRIELGEIETALATHPSIAQAVVTVVTNLAGDKELAAYLRHSQDPPAEQDVRTHLARTLPAAMIPAHLIPLPEFPLNSSGKVDKKALPAPRRVPETAAEAAPETPAEILLANLYATLLGIPRVGATDSFFDLGGNSLTAMRLVDLISQQTGVALSVTSVFLHPTPRRLATTLGSGTLEGAPRTGPLVKLSAGGPPMILVHPIGGTISAYTPLVQELAGELTVYGLESPALNDPGAVPRTLADLVTEYTRRIRSVLPSGPYELAGWSMGAVIAFEVARRLEQTGAEVSLLTMLDPPFAVPAGFLPGESELAARFVADAAESLALDTAEAPDPATADPDEQLTWLARQLGGTGAGPGPLAPLAPLGPLTLAAQLHRRFALFAAHTRMLAGYRPASPGVRAPALIVSADRSPNAPARERWPDLLTGPVSVMSVDSDHYAFLRPPLVADLAAAIRTWREGHPDGA